MDLYSTYQYLLMEREKWKDVKIQPFLLCSFRSCIRGTLNSFVSSHELMNWWNFMKSNSYCYYNMIFIRFVTQYFFLQSQISLSSSREIWISIPTSIHCMLWWAPVQLLKPNGDIDGWMLFMEVASWSRLTVCLVFSSASWDLSFGIVLYFPHSKVNWAATCISFTEPRVEISCY